MVANGQRIGGKTYSYDEQGNLVKVVINDVYYNEGSDIIIRFSYLAQRFIKKTWFVIDGKEQLAFETQYEFDEAGRIAKEYECGGDESIFYVTTYQYQDARLIGATFLNYGVYDGELRVEYNSVDNPTKVSYYDKAQGIDTELMIVYPEAPREAAR